MDESSDDGAVEPAVELPTDLPPPVPWSTVGELEVDDQGEAGWVEVPLAAGQRYFAVRSIPVDGRPSDGSRPCHRVLEARWSSGSMLMPADGQGLQPEHQRFVPGPGGGVFVMSTNEAPLSQADTLELHLGLYDCGLEIPASRARFPGMPHRIRIETASEAESHSNAPTATVAVRLARAEDSGWGSMDQDPMLAQAWAVAVERFADIGIELSLEAETTVPMTDIVEYEADMVAFGSLQQQVHERLQHDQSDARFVPVALVRCLDYTNPTGTGRSRPLGQATRVPGSIAERTTPSLVVVASGDCDRGSDAQPSQAAERYGVVLAHEIGHYLGLFHSDTELGRHLPTTMEQALMDSAIATRIDPDQAWFSGAQAAVMRRHPDVVISD